MAEHYAARASDGRLLALLTASCLALSLVLGGGTRTGFLSDAVLQVAAVPLLALALLSLRDIADRPQFRSALLICAAIAAVPALQLLPLPSAIWQKLPGHSVHSENLETLGLALPWLPVSVSPRATALSLVSLIVPIAIFLGTCQLSFPMRRKMSLVVIGIGLVSVLLGFLQVAQGPSSPLRLFEFTNLTEAVGFFANRNHFSALLYCLMLFAAAWTLWYARAFERAGASRRFAPRIIVPMIAGLAAVVMLVAEQAMARSRAGLGLTILALLGAFVMAYSTRRHDNHGKLAGRLLVGALAVGLVFSSQLALYRVLERFEVDPLGDARLEFAKITLAAAKAYAPLGSGLGTFGPVYAQFEQPKDVLIEAYVNRAHNDLLELLLETGAAGVLLALVCVLWFVRRMLAVWRASAGDSPNESEVAQRRDERGPFAVGQLGIDRILARAATIVVILLVAHSLVDYPLRTGAIASVLAFALALLVSPPFTPVEMERGEVEPREKPARSRPRVAPSQQPAAFRPLQQPPQPAHQHRPVAGAADQRTPWNSEWPEAWRSPATKGDKRSGGDEGA